jgi:hypothetical protein
MVDYFNLVVIIHFELKNFLKKYLIFDIIYFYRIDFRFF